MYNLGDASYFSESAYEQSDSANKYWGTNLEALEEIKAKYDPDSVFNCYHCVGYIDGAMIIQPLLAFFLIFNFILWVLSRFI